MKQIKNIIFDLGGVIMNIDFQQTNEAFRLLGMKNFSDHISPHKISYFFEQFETGYIDDESFVKGLSQLINKPVRSQQVVAAWNALLLDFPPERISLLQKIRPRYRTFLLSNTNSIHTREFQQRLFNLYGVYLEDLFEKAYYSHVVQLRKPDAAIFSLVLKENQLEPSETMFIDDTATNFPEAEKLGIQTFHLKPGMSVTEIELFKEFV